MFKFLAVVSTVLAMTSGILAQEPTNSAAKPGNALVPGPRDWQFTTRAYQEAAFRVLLEEVNRVAQDLNLPEKLPITKSNLVEVFIGPPALGGIGTLSTSNYVYYVTSGRKFHGLDQRRLDETFEEAIAKYLLPLSREDTNAAMKMASQIMKAAGMDIDGLNRDCTIEIIAAGPYGILRNKFVPDYTIVWRKSARNVAALEFLEPTRTIRSLHVDPRYLKICPPKGSGGSKSRGVAETRRRPEGSPPKNGT